MATTSAQLSAAARDADLRERLTALAAAEGIENPAAWVELNMRRLVAVPFEDGKDDTIASVYDYAVATYKPTPRPGENPASVTDAQMISSLKKVSA